jgi:type IV fimbrial biogenesis protein FimT
LLDAEKRWRVLKRLRRAAGFSVIELMMVVAIIGVVLMLAVPSFAEFLQNQQIRSASDAILNGLQVARAEAIRRNLSVEVAINVPETGWVVSESAAPRTVIQRREHQEGSRNANVVTVPGGATTVTFTPLGGVTGNQDGSFPVTQIDIDNPAGGACQTTSGGPMRCLRILVTGGGSLRMCDPKLPVTTPPDPRACP